MPEVIQAENHWQLSPAIGQWLAGRPGGKSALVFYDRAALSYFLSQRKEAFRGQVQIELSESIQARLLTTTAAWLQAEKERPGSRDDLLFEILHHPAWQLDPQEIDRLALQFYQTRGSTAFHSFLRSQNLLESAGSTSVREAVIQLSALQAEEDIRVPMSRFFASEEQGIQKEIWEALARGEEYLTLVAGAGDAPEICFGEHSGQQHVLHIFPEAGHTEQDCIIRGPALFKPRIPMLPDEWLRHSLKNYRLSVSHLNNFLRCPLAFYFEVVLRSPGRKSPAMAFGSAVHEALEHFFRIMLRGKSGVFPEEAVLSEAFEAAMQKQRSFFPAEISFQEKVRYGKESLSDYYRRKQGGWKRVVSIERRIQTRIDEVPVHGFLDKIEFDHYNADIIDYKTGQVSGSVHRFAAPGRAGDDFPFENSLGGNYWRQAVFYHLLIAHNPGTRWKPRKVIFDYIEKQKNGPAEIIITPGNGEKELVRGQIRDMYASIQNRAFDTGCGRAGCHWCRFVVEHGYPVSAEQGKTI